jgi:flotillin
MSQIQKDASIAKAAADRDVAIAEAEAAKAANEARVNADKDIAERQNDLAIRQAELKEISDVKKAKADAAYKIQEQEQRKSIEITTVSADIAKAEQEALLKEKEVEVTKQTLDAEIRAKADADRYAAEQKAQADLFKRQKDAEAKLFEEQQAAEAAKARASANLFEAQKKAEGISAVGLAEAEAIKAKSLAEAEGIEKKAEAQKKMGEASVIEMITAVLPEIAKNVAEPLTKVDKITMYGDGNSAKLIQDIINGTTQVTEGMLGGMGIDLPSLVSGFIGGKAATPKTAPEQGSMTDKKSEKTKDSDSE